MLDCQFLCSSLTECWVPASKHLKSLAVLGSLAVSASDDWWALFLPINETHFAGLSYIAAKAAPGTGHLSAQSIQSSASADAF